MRNTASTPAQSEQPGPAKQTAVKVNRRPVHTRLDGRTWEYRLLQKMRADLSGHVGGAPSAPQKALIDRAAWLTVYLAQQDARTASGEFMSEHMSRQYLSWNNSLVRAMRALGFKGATERGPTLREHLAAKASAA